LWARGLWAGGGALDKVFEIVVPAGNAPEPVAFLDADEEVVGAQVRRRDEPQRDRRQWNATLCAAANRAGHGRLLRRLRLSGVELAGGRLVADALAIALGRLGELERQRAAGVVVVPEES
jgi:hypothetical protein